MGERREFAGRLVVVLLPFAIAVAVAGMTIWSSSSRREFLLLILGLLVPLPLIVRGLQHRLDPFEPIAVLSVALFALFVLRPIAHLAYGKMTYADLSLDAGFDSALTVAAFGVAALYCGYAAPAGRRIAQLLRPLPNAVKPEATTMVAVGLVVIGFLLYAVYIEQVGGLGVAKRLLSGRDPLEGSITSSGTVYFLFGPFLAIPATLLLFEAAAAKRRALSLLLIALGTGLVVILVAGPRGDRLWLMLLALGVFVLPYLRAQKRPRIRTVAVISLLWFAVGITFLADVRVPIARQGSPLELFKKTATNPLRGWHNFVLGADTEMFSILALETERVPSSQAHEPGITLLSLATNWIPRRFYPTKPVTADEKVYTMLLPKQASYSKAGTAPSIFGGFYYDSGLVGVLIGSMLFGVLARALYEYLLKYPASAGVRLLYASTLPFIIVLLRGNPTDTLARMLYIVFPILITLWLTGRRGSESVNVRTASVGVAG